VAVLRELALGVGRVMVALMVQYGGRAGANRVVFLWWYGPRAWRSLTDLMHAVRQLKFFIGSHVCACALVAQ
jgi:hypothetical protein